MSLIVCLLKRSAPLRPSTGQPVAPGLRHGSAALAVMDARLPSGVEWACSVMLAAGIRDLGGSASTFLHFSHLHDSRRHRGRSAPASSTAGHQTRSDVAPGHRGQANGAMPFSSTPGLQLAAPLAPSRAILECQRMDLLPEVSFFHLPSVATWHGHRFWQPVAPESEVDVLRLPSVATWYVHSFRFRELHCPPKFVWSLTYKDTISDTTAARTPGPFRDRLSNIGHCCNLILLSLAGDGPVVSFGTSKSEILVGLNVRNAPALLRGIYLSQAFTSVVTPILELAKEVADKRRRRETRSRRRRQQRHASQRRHHVSQRRRWIIEEILGMRFLYADDFPRMSKQVDEWLWQVRVFNEVLRKHPALFEHALRWKQTSSQRRQAIFVYSKTLTLKDVMLPPLRWKRRAPGERIVIYCREMCLTPRLRWKQAATP